MVDFGTLDSPKLAPTYVRKLLAELQTDFEGMHKRMAEVERLRYMEDKTTIPPEERQAGLEVRIGATAELIENVKAAMTAMTPNVVFHGLREGDEADSNTSKREVFWREFIRSLNYPIPILGEFVDGQAGVGLGILKAAYSPWPRNERRRRSGESDQQFRERTRALKKKWGPPFSVAVIHPLTFFFRLGPRNQLIESIEHAYKPKREVLAAFGLQDRLPDFMSRPNVLRLDPEAKAASVASISGQPDERIQPLPYGATTSTLALVTEYLAHDIYQCYIDGRLVYEQENPAIRYFLAVGRTTSSRDPDKMGLSIAENLRQNEPIINRVLTRVAEAADLVVKKRLAVTLPEGASPPIQVGVDNNPEPLTWEFTSENAKALPPGAAVTDPFEGVENVFSVLPFLELMFRVLGQQGVSPIFKGIPPGAGGSGYRDNSLYLMATSQFQYLIDSYADAIGQLVQWGEEMITTRARTEVWVGEHSLKPADITDFPATVEIDVDPLLPQNLVAEGGFWDRMHTKGHIRRRTMLEKGLHFAQPEDEIFGRMMEDVQDLLKPILYQDVLQTVGVIPSVAQQQGLVGPDGQPISANGGRGAPGSNSGIQNLLSALSARNPNAASAISGAVGRINQSDAGMSRQGQPRQPPFEPGEFPPEGER